MIPLYTLIDLLPYTNARGENYYYALQYFVCDDNRPIPYLDLPFWVFDIGNYNAVTNIITICKNVVFARKSISRFFGCCENNKIELNSRVISRQSRKCYWIFLCLCFDYSWPMFDDYDSYIFHSKIINHLSCRIKMVVLQKDLCVIVYIVLC